MEYFIKSITGVIYDVDAKDLPKTEMELRVDDLENKINQILELLKGK